MSEKIVLEFVDQKIKAEAVLLTELAGDTCDMILKVLPIEGMALHARYSGSEIAMRIEPKVMADMSKLKNTTSVCTPGDVAFFCGEAGLSFKRHEDLSEFAIFYDQDVVPCEPEGPVAPSIFAHIDKDFEEFQEVCFDIRRTGQKKLKVYKL